MGQKAKMAVHDQLNQRLEQCRVYKVTYAVLGPKTEPPIAVIRSACVVAMDVADLVDQIRKTCVGVEITGTDSNGKFYHGIAEDVEIESAQLAGRLHGITERAYRIITTCDKQEKSGD